jgi:hypothetical protein
MFRVTTIALSALLAALPLSQAVAQDRDSREERRDRRPQFEQRDERPRVGMGEAVQRASSGRSGRFLGASDRGGVIVVRWEYPGGRIADIMVDGRTGRVIGER